MSSRRGQLRGLVKVASEGDWGQSPHNFMTRISIQTTLLLLLALLADVSGCGPSNRPKLVTVTGKVMMNGRPLTAGAIIFHPSDGNSFRDDKPSSLLQTDGSFLIKTFPFGDGVPPGKYKVTLAPELATRIQRPDFGDPKKTTWSVEVPENGLRDQRFEVK